MANYKEKTVAGSEYVRCSEVRIFNPLGGVPTINFSEENVTTLSTKTLTEGGSGFVLAFDPSKTYPMLDPVTGDALGGSVTLAEVYAMIYSVYVGAAVERDNG